MFNFDQTPAPPTRDTHDVTPCRGVAEDSRTQLFSGNKSGEKLGQIAANRISYARAKVAHITRVRAGALASRKSGYTLQLPTTNYAESTRAQMHRVTSVILNES